MRATYILEPFRSWGMQSRWQAKTAFTQPSGPRAEGFELASQFCKEAEVREAICADYPRRLIEQAADRDGKLREISHSDYTRAEKHAQHASRGSLLCGIRLMPGDERRNRSRVQHVILSANQAAERRPNWCRRCVIGFGRAARRARRWRTSAPSSGPKSCSRKVTKISAPASGRAMRRLRSAIGAILAATACQMVQTPAAAARANRNGRATLITVSKSATDILQSWYPVNQMPGYRLNALLH